jgi:Holliday junction resolvase
MKDWERSEKDCERNFGKKQPGSGAGMLKMDIKGMDNFAGEYYENKFTEKDSFSIRAETIKKAIRQARQMGGKPVIRIDFGSHNLKMILVEEVEWIKLHDS